jgi:hypothetical protein
MTKSLLNHCQSAAAAIFRNFLIEHSLHLPDFLPDTPG